MDSEGEVTVDSGGCTLALAGTFTEAADPVAAALTGAQVSTLRYDKRGVATAREPPTARTWPTRSGLPESSRCPTRRAQATRCSTGRRNRSRPGCRRWRESSSGSCASMWRARSGGGWTGSGHPTPTCCRVQGARVNARWFRDFAAYDPAPTLARVAVPMPALAITGGQDLQVPPLKGHVPADLSHLLRPDPAGIGPRAYRRAARKPELTPHTHRR